LKFNQTPHDFHEAFLFPCMMRIQEATSEDIPVIQRIAYTTWPPTFGEILSKEQIDYMLTMMYSREALEMQMSRGHTFILISDEHQPLGYASYELYSSNTSLTKIHKLYLLPSAQGRGIGKTLIDTIKNIARAKEQSGLTLNVNIHNKAISFYQHYGFQIQGSEIIDIGNGFVMDDYIMTFTF
jgi:ribosomal protein S18 acetylase RimI-like enzyme